MKFLKFLGHLQTLLVSKANLLQVHQIKKVNRRQVKLTAQNQIPVTTRVNKPLTTRRPNSISSCYNSNQARCTQWKLTTSKNLSIKN